MKSLLFIFFTLFINFSYATNIDDSELLAHYESFKKEAIESKTLSPQYLERLNNVKIQYVNMEQMDSRYIAECNFKDNVVSVNKFFFIKNTELHRQEIIDHELGHCVLLRSHYNLSNLVGGMEVPTDIMHHSTFPYEDENQMAKMRKELFSPQFYGTILEVDKLNNKNEVIISQDPYADWKKVRGIEHFVMQERIEKYNKRKK